MDSMIGEFYSWLSSPTQWEKPTQWLCAFLPENNGYYVNYIVYTLFVETAMDLMRVSDLFYYFGCLLFSKSEAEKPTIEREKSFPEFKYGNEYSKICIKFTVIVFYRLSSPIITIFGFLCLAVKYFVDKHNLVYAYGFSRNNKTIHITAIYLPLIAPSPLQMIIYYFVLMNNGPRSFAIYSCVLIIVQAVCFYGLIFLYGQNHNEVVSFFCLPHFFFILLFLIYGIAVIKITFISNFKVTNLLFLDSCPITVIQL